MSEYKLIIVDDEFFIRDQLAKLLDWQSVGFEIAGVFGTFDDTMDFLRQNKVDVIFTDIRLGSHRGLDLVAQAKRLYPEVESVLISAFSEFEYAHEAIKLEVFEYLVKPIYLEKLTDCFIRLKQKLDERLLRISEANEHIGFAKYSLYSDIFAGMIRSEAHAADFAKMNHFEFNQAEQSYLFIRLDDRRGDFKTLPFFGENSITSNLAALSGGFEVFTVALTGGYLYILMLLTEDWRNDPDGAFGRLCCNLTAGLGDGLEYTIVDSDTNVFDIAERFLVFTNRQPTYYDFMLKVKEYIKSGEATLASNLVKSVCEQYSLNGEGIRSFIKYLLDGIVENESPDKKLIDEFLLKLDKLAPEDALLEVGGLFDKLSGQMSNLAYNKYYISIAKKYVVEHISEDLSLERVATHIALSPAYFSRYFRETTGEKFIDFLNRARIEYAKTLLSRPDIRVSSIYKMVGYNSRSWFYNVFSGETGLTPYEYRQKLLESGGAFEK